MGKSGKSIHGSRLSGVETDLKVNLGKNWDTERDPHSLENKYICITKQ